MSSHQPEHGAQADDIHSDDHSEAADVESGPPEISLLSTHQLLFPNGPPPMSQVHAIIVPVLPSNLAGTGGAADTQATPSAVPLHVLLQALPPQHAHLGSSAEETITNMIGFLQSLINIPTTETGTTSATNYSFHGPSTEDHATTADSGDVDTSTATETSMWHNLAPSTSGASPPPSPPPFGIFWPPVTLPSGASTTSSPPPTPFELVDTAGALAESPPLMPGPSTHSPLPALTQDSQPQNSLPTIVSAAGNDNTNMTAEAPVFGPQAPMLPLLLEFPDLADHIYTTLAGGHLSSHGNLNTTAATGTTLVPPQAPVLPMLLGFPNLDHHGSPLNSEDVSTPEVTASPTTEAEKRADIIAKLPTAKKELWLAAQERVAKDTCVICKFLPYEDGEAIVGLPCGHFFHRDCLKPWLDQYDDCPTCRVKVPGLEKRKNARLSDANDIFW